MATGIEAAIPDDLAEKALAVLMAFGDAIRGPGFDNAVDVDDDASAQDKLIAFSGRQPKAPSPSSPKSPPRQSPIPEIFAFDHIGCG